MTEYKILREEEKENIHVTVWHEIEGTVKASSTKRALADIKTPGNYVAVPVRSWRPLAVKVENTVKVTIG